MDMVIKRKLYSKAGNIIAGAAGVGTAGLILGTAGGIKLGTKMARKKSSEEEKKEAAKKRIKENEDQIEDNKKNLPKYKEAAREEREILGPKKNWDALDKEEMDMLDEMWKSIPKENKQLRKENQELRKGNYESILSDTPTSRKYVKGGAILGAGSGIAIGAAAGHLINKIRK